MRSIAILSILFFTATSMMGLQDSVDVRVNLEESRGVISPYMLGLHAVYSNEKDAAYSDGSVAEWAKRVSVGTMRYPGGTIVKYWDWESPSGYMTEDPYDPNWSGVVAPEEDWMSFDEYIDFVAKSGITPMFGVNYRSGYVYNRTEDGVARAVRMVEEARDRGYGGAIWYIGNEDRHMVGGLEASAHLFVQYAKAMKSADSDIIIYFNDNDANPKTLKRFLAIAGDYADGVELHGKWPLGGEKGDKLPHNFETWQDEIPLMEHEPDGSIAWRYRAEELRKAAAEAGYPNLLVANNEYGVGANFSQRGFNRYTTSLMLVDYTQELIIGNFDSSALWANQLKYGGLLSNDSGEYRLNPIALGFELIGSSLGGDKVGLESSDRDIYGYAARKDDRLYIYLLNKRSDERHIAIEAISRAEFVEARSMVNTTDDWGEIVAIKSYKERNGALSLTVGELSYTRLEYKILNDK